MTEAEAKTLLCCGPPAIAAMQLAAALIIAGRDPDGHGRLDTLCHGAACAAWRWRPAVFSDGGVRGYCGLAGPAADLEGR